MKIIGLWHDMKSYKRLYRVSFVNALLIDRDIALDRLARCYNASNKRSDSVLIKQLLFRYVSIFKSIKTVKEYNELALKLSKQFSGNYSTTYKHIQLHGRDKSKIRIYKNSIINKFCFYTATYRLENMKKARLIRIEKEKKEKCQCCKNTENISFRMSSVSLPKDYDYVRSVSGYFCNKCFNKLKRLQITAKEIHDFNLQITQLKRVIKNGNT